MPNALSEMDQAYLAAEIGCFEWPLSALVATPGTIAETAVGVVGPGPLALDLAAIVIHPAAGLTANGTNFVTITVAKRTGGGAPVTLATLATNVTSWTAWTPINMSLVANAFLSPGDAITVKSVASGTGVQVPQLYLAGFVAVR